MILKIPLDLGFCTVLTGIRSGERTPTGAVRMGLRSDPHRRRGAADSGRGQSPPATSDRARGSLRATGSRRPEQATVTASGQTGSTGNRRRRGPAGSLRATGEARRGNRASQLAAGRRGSGSEPKDLGPPQLASERTVPRHQDRWHGQPGQRETVTTGRNRATGSGPEKGIARPAARRDGRCEQVESKANARRSTDGGYVPPWEPRKERRRKQAAPTGALCCFQLARPLLVCSASERSLGPRLWSASREACSLAVAVPAVRWSQAPSLRARVDLRGWSGLNVGLMTNCLAAIIIIS